MTWSLSRSVVDIPRDFPLMENYLCQWVLTVASCIGMGHSIYFPILLESVNTVTVSLCPYVYLSCCIKMALLSWTHPFSVAFTFCLSPHHHRSLSLKVVVGNELSEVSHSLHIVHSWVCVLIAIYCKKRTFYDVDWTRHWYMGISICH